MSKRNGGSAFPVYTPDMNVGDDAGPGMTLRDWFAGQALAAVQGTNPNLPDDPASTRFFPESHELARRQATWAYLVADAMLAERSKP